MKLEAGLCITYMIYGQKHPRIGLNLRGTLIKWAVTSVDFSLAQLIQVMILLGSGGKNGGGYEASEYVVMAMHGGILFSHAILNSLSISLLSFLGQFAAAWNVLGT